jgi:CO/xanthine dehydrogenase FAD-binding subunit
MQAFSYVSAKSVSEAASILAAEGDNARVLSGGTDIIVQLREGRRKAGVVVDVKAIPELNALKYDPAQGLSVGAAVPCHRIYNDAAIAKAYPGLIDSVTLIGGTAIQGRASLGGNVCTASPAGDSIPTLIALEALCVVVSKNITREIPIEKFFAGPGKTVLQPGELLTGFRIPAPKARSGAAYLRFIPRNEMDIAVVSAGVSVQLDANGRNFVSARIALGAVAPTPLYVPEAGAALAGQPVGDAAIERAAELAKAAAKPISDMRGSAAQRKHLSAVMTRRALEIAVARARQS